MRIIGGELGGRRLSSPKGQGTRPMLDRVREALFSTLGERVEGARVLDLFAGGGSLGLEALSRGAAFVRAVERDPAALRVLAANAAALGVGQRLEVQRGDALSEKPLAPPAGTAAPWLDLLFFDPPYPLLLGERPRVLGAFARAVAALVPGGVAVLHAPRRILAAAELGGSARAEERTYGTTSLWYVERAAGAAED